MLAETHRNMLRPHNESSPFDNMLKCFGRCLQIAGGLMMQYLGLAAGLDLGRCLLTGTIAWERLISLAGSILSVGGDTLPISFNALRAGLATSAGSKPPPAGMTAQDNAAISRRLACG